jgi:hypothetical protein
MSRRPSGIDFRGQTIREKISNQRSRLREKRSLSYRCYLKALDSQYDRLNSIRKDVPTRGSGYDNVYRAILLIRRRSQWLS